MSAFTQFIDNLEDSGKLLAKTELKNLIDTAKQDESDFVRLQAENLERWTVMLADDDLTVKGYKKLVTKIEILDQMEMIKLSVQAKASAQRLSNGVQTRSYTESTPCRYIAMRSRPYVISPLTGRHAKPPTC